jgi:outer membrane murein-binding lipoprotein Lpp
VIRIRSAAAWVVAVGILAGCSGPAAPASFDPSQPCGGVAQQTMAGAYPDLEATVPSTLAGQPATGRESGRYCSAESLGTLAEAGIAEVHFGAATWDRGSGKALSLVTLEAVGLTDQAVFDSYIAGAVGNSKIHDLATSAPTLGGGPGHRLDFLNGDSSFQRILVWPGDRTGRVRVVLAADLVDADIQAAVDAFR